MRNSVTTFTVDRDEFVKRCEDVYAGIRESLERQHYAGSLPPMKTEWQEEDVDSAYQEAADKHPDKLFYFRRIERNAILGPSYENSLRNNLPVVNIEVIRKTSHEVEAHIDFSASKTIVPPSLAENLGLRLAGFENVAVGAGVIITPEYVAIVEAFGKKHRILLGCLDLPREAPVRALIGRGILDRYKVLPGWKEWRDRGC